MPTPGWNYYNGDNYTKWGTTERVYVPMTEWYCHECGPTHIKKWNADVRPGSQHWDSGFRCAPWHIGKPCCGCGKDI